MRSSPIPRPRKRFGQNFLQDNLVIHQICQAIQPRQGEYLVEIGPGQGALTRELLKITGQLIAIELDRDLIAPLRKACSRLGNLTILQQDILTVNWHALAEDKGRLRLVGNLPYNISSALLFHCFAAIETIQDMHFMLQLEVAERLTAAPGCKAYGRLSVMAQYFCQPLILFHVPPTAFFPQPKVMSAVVRLLPHTPPLLAKDFLLFSEIVQVAFSQRRKTLTNALKPYISASQLEALEIAPNLRPENLTLVDFVTIANFLKTLQPIKPKTY